MKNCVFSFSLLTNLKIKTKIKFNEKIQSTISFFCDRFIQVLFYMNAMKTGRLHKNEQLFEAETIQTIFGKGQFFH